MVIPLDSTVTIHTGDDPASSWPCTSGNNSQASTTAPSHRLGNGGLQRPRQPLQQEGLPQATHVCKGVTASPQEDRNGATYLLSRRQSEPEHTEPVPASTPAGRPVVQGGSHAPGTPLPNVSAKRHAATTLKGRATTSLHGVQLIDEKEETRIPTASPTADPSALRKSRSPLSGGSVSIACLMATGVLLKREVRKTLYFYLPTTMITAVNVILVNLLF